MTSSKTTAALSGSKTDSRKIKRKRQPAAGSTSERGGFLSGPLEGAPAQAASTFLEANYQLFTQQRSMLQELQVKKVASSPAGYHVTFQQVHQGLPVEGATISVHMTKDQRVHAASGQLKSEVLDLDVHEIAKDGINQNEAIRIALDSTVGSLAALAQAEQVICTEVEPRLAWKVSLVATQAGQEWVVWVDAQSGKVLDRQEISIA